MFRLTLSAAAAALLLAAAVPAIAAGMSAEEYEKALEKCDDAQTTARRDDCIAEVQNRYDQARLDAATGKIDQALPNRDIDNKLPDRTLPDRKISRDPIDKTIPDRKN